MKHTYKEFKIKFRTKLTFNLVQMNSLKLSIMKIEIGMQIIQR